MVVGDNGVVFQGIRSHESQLLSNIVNVTLVYQKSGTVLSIPYVFYMRSSLPIILLPEEL